MRSGASSYCTRQGYRVAAGGEPLTPRHAHVEHPRQNRTLPRDAHCRRTSHAMVVHAQSISGRQHLPDACQSEVNNAWQGRERGTSDNPRCQFNSRQATQRVAENVGQPQNPNSTRHGRTPHANASTPGRLAAQRFRAQRDAHLRADNLRHARAARRTRPDNTFLTYDSNRGGNSPLAVQQSGQQFLTLITKTTPCHGVEAGQATLLMYGMCVTVSRRPPAVICRQQTAPWLCNMSASSFSVVEFVTRAVFSTQIAAQHPPLEGACARSCNHPRGHG